jgi:hypothetical protein
MWAMSADPFNDNGLDADSPEGLADIIDAQRNTLISVATGGPRIDDMDAEYQRRHRVLKAGLQRIGISPPFPWNSLWDWYGYYSGKLGSYAQRRIHVNQLADPVLEELTRIQTRNVVSDWGAAPESWATVEDRLSELKVRLSNASSLDDYQDVGRRSREIVIAAVNISFDPEMVPTGDEVPKGADAKNRLEHILNSSVPGSSHAELRKVMRAALDLAHKVTHGDDITAIDAFASAQATVLVVRTLIEIEK